MDNQGKIKKTAIAYFLLVLLFCYIISPWFFEKSFLFNEILALSGLCFLVYKKFKVGGDRITFYIVILLGWGLVHAFISLARMDSIYYYFRNSVIIYSVLTYFSGYYLVKYLGGFLERIFWLFRIYILFFLVFRVSSFLYERFGMATLFPFLFRRSAGYRRVLFLLILLNFIYAYSYSSFTSFVIAVFFIFLLFCRRYAVFKVFFIFGAAAFAVLFIYLLPNLSLINETYNYSNEVGIYTVISSNRLLQLDYNSTWRLVLWKQLIVDNFPGNLFGYGFGTPVLKYFPVADYSKLQTLPYVLGAHNSYVYLFCRLGIVYIVLSSFIYRIIFREFFEFRQYYLKSYGIYLFYSFFAFSIIALFNPVLESPVYAGGYWFFLGMLAKIIADRQSRTE